MTDTILPHELPHALDRAPAGIRVLSLDCFDTLLWRDCHAPADLFGELGEPTTGQRMGGEAQARKAETTWNRRSEVTLPAIYAHALPGADDTQLHAAIARELAAEARACFAFAPTVDLMRAARARGIRVAIVSDTYLDADQLRDLIATAAGEEVAGLIDTIIVSSTAGISKTQGLLAHALKAARCRAHEVLHIGDNLRADYEGARALGIPALHLVQFGDAAARRLRFERACRQLAGEARQGIRGLQPHRALLARDEPVIADPARRLGFAVLGPLFHAFDQWLRREAEALESARGGTVHWLFMLRDGHLSHRVNRVGGPATRSAPVEISRFTATAASLTSREAYDRHVALEQGLNPATLARQMLMTESEIELLVGRAESAEDKAKASTRLLAELRKGQRQKVTLRRARAMADRLVEHVRAAVDPQPGDTLMLVDLGYNGSAQNRVDALLAEAFDVHVAGRYLLLREMAASGLDKRGLIDEAHFEPEFCEALCGNVAVLEQLSTCELGSVTDYSETGEPIRTASGLKGSQSAVRDAVQAGVCDFARAALDPPIVRVADPHRERAWREGAAAALARFMFLPQPDELKVVKSFEHDINMGSARMVPLFDADRAREGMRRRGLFYMKGSARMYLPAELAEADMSTRLALFAQKRFGLGLTYEDYAPSVLEIPAFFVGAQGSAHAQVQALPTHDGFAAIRVPVGEGGTGVAVQLGAACEWIEVAGISCAPVRSLKGGAQNDAVPIPVAARFDAMTEHAPGIFECLGETALLLIEPEALPKLDEPAMIEIVVRPLRLRGDPALQLARTTGLAQSAIARLGSAAA
ncbi:HAD family hydrolase [Erythrobacter sp. JK5]|uniref:HAD family hydrolase n=1 Tax=Erythrobacter sp. JK5 TaxID=2829500 RepID=UPI001BA50976|nr:HAD family hydrolase [Erythrobacter sp. JK5]QUL36917.1 HAD hydrolase-like protein [Erythrobacter sp. JK5]